MTFNSEQVYHGGFSEDQFEALADALRTVKAFKLVIESSIEQPGSDTSADH
jgi:hypothetical protein